MRTSFKILVILVGTFLGCSFNLMGQDGEAIFQKNCAACHKLGMRLVGPDLVGIHDRRDEQWLLKFIKSSQSMIKAGDPDAVAIFEEYNKVMMVDMAHLTDGDVKSVLEYIRSQSPAATAKTDTGTGASKVAQMAPVEYSEADINNGRQLYAGDKKLAKGGPSCLSCHNVNNDDLYSGGALAKDLTNVYARMGDAGLAGILSAPPFPAMTVAYTNHELDSAEIAQITAFLKHADAVSASQQVKAGSTVLIIGGGGGLIVLFLIIALHWNMRLKQGVKEDIYNRQIKSV